MVHHTHPTLLRKLRGLSAEGDKDDDGGDGSQGDFGPHRISSWRDPAIDLQNAALRQGSQFIRSHPLLAKQVSQAVDNKKLSRVAAENPEAERQLENQLNNRLRFGKGFNPTPNR